MSAYSSRAFLLNNSEPPSIGNSVTEEVISQVDLISCDDSKDLYVVAECSGVSGAGTVIKLQECHRKDGTFTDVSGATVTVTGNGNFEIYYRSESTSIKPFLRVVVTTGGSDAVTIDKLFRTRRI